MLETAVALVLGHVVADFVLQTDAMIRDKHRPPVFAQHLAIVALATWLALGVPDQPLLIAIVAGSHALIDAAKIRWGGKGFRGFALDQAAHLAIIGLGAALFPAAWAGGVWAGPAFAAVPGINRLPEIMALAAGLIATVWAGGYAVQALMTGVPTPRYPSSLPRGGRLIGRLERIAILMLVLAGEPAAIGFLVAAKSILRFNEIARDRDRHTSEYVIIGTLASFSWAIATAYATEAALAALRRA
jgi:hypothetical protein